MRIFVTGATGWIGSAVVDQLLSSGHEVTGLARSAAAAATLEGKGAQPWPGDLDHPESLRSGAEHADAVVHLAYKHDFTDPAASNRAERESVQALGEVLVGSQRPLIIAAGVTFLTPGRIATEQDRSPFHGAESPRGGSENLALEFVGRGVNTVAVRFAPTVHGPGDQGFLATLVATAKAKGVSGYIGDGASRWAAVHRSDAARVVVLSLEQAIAAGTVMHAVAETGISTRKIAEAIGGGLGLPTVSIPVEEAPSHFGWLSMFYGTDIAASSDTTRAILGWSPSGPTLDDDLVSGSYFRRAELGAPR